jgi:hypothetical protein
LARDERENSSEIATRVTIPGQEDVRVPGNAIAFQEAENAERRLTE